MESSTVLAFRIFVMLSCLIIVPMAAIFGSAFPDVVKSVLVDRIVSWSTGKPVEAPAEPAAGDGFREVTPGTASELAVHDGSAVAPRWTPPQVDPGPWAQNAAAGNVVALGTGGAPAGQNQSASFSSPAPSVYGQPGAAAAPHQDPHVQPADAAVAAVAHVAAVERAAPASGQSDRFTEIERKLRENGATYYLLETWGNNGELYRFHCRMAVGSDPNYTRHFEATHRDPLEAMSEVLARVEAWRAGRLQ